MSFYFEDLIVWKKAFLLVEKTHAVLKKFPKEEQYALTDQIRRSSISIVSNIAEGSGRSSNAENIQFMSIAKGSSMEYATQIMLADKFGYDSHEVFQGLLDLDEEIVKMLSVIIFKRKI